MRILAKALLLLTAGTGPAAAQEEPMTDAQAAYHAYKSDRDIMGADFPSAFYDEMQVLTDEEHGWNAPDRLYAFESIRKSEARDEGTDRTVLAPWLIRYLWITPYPNYTQGAWRVIHDLRLPDDLMLVAARDVLENHPHGLARAAVVEATDRYQPWLEDEAFMALTGRLAFEDPHPEVRRNAVSIAASVMDGTLDPARIEKALTSDPAAEVRVALAEALVSTVSEADRTEAPLRAALFAPENRAVAPEMMRVYLRSGTVQSDLQRLSQGLTFLARHRDHPLADRIEDTFGWQMDEASLPLFLSGAPYEDGEALRRWLHEVFADETRPLTARGEALAKLVTLRRERIDTGAIAAFLLDPRHDRHSLSPLFNFSLGSDAAERLLTAPPPAATGEARGAVEWLDTLLAFLSEPDAAGDMRGDADTHIGLLREASRFARRARSEEDRRATVELALSHVERTPLNVTYGISEMLEDRRMVDDARLVAFAQALTPEASFSSLSTAFVDRMRPGPWQDPEPQDGDFGVALALLSAIEERYADDPAERDYAMNTLFRELPDRSAVPDDLPGLAAFEARVRELRPLVEEDASYWVATGWLER